MSQDERQLILKCKSNDHKAFDALMQLYQSKVYNIAYGMLGNEHDALDATQDTFIKVFKSINTFNESSGFYTWVYRITCNVCLDMLRKRKRQNLFSFNMWFNNDGDEEEIQLPDNAPSVEESVINTELQNAVRLAILELKEDFRIVIVLRDINGFSYEEIANMLNISTGTVKSRISRARNALKNILTKSGVELFGA